MSESRVNRRYIPFARKLRIIAQDPSVKIKGRILTAEVDVPAEELLPGPQGYRVNVIDYDASANVLYKPAIIPSPGTAAAATSEQPTDDEMLGDPRFHAQNAYAIVMRTLACFELALGRRVPWGSRGHQLHLAPHAFAEANAFYSRDDRGLFFGYFMDGNEKPVFTCLSHDVVAHETTHAVLDGLCGRFLEPSSADQAAFHEGFSDVVALLSVFSLREVVGKLLDGGDDSELIDKRHLTDKALRKSVLVGLAEQMGEALSEVRGNALRQSAQLEAGRDYLADPEFEEPHRRGELLVAAIMGAFIDIWLERIRKLGTLRAGKKDRSMVLDEGARVANHLLTMAIRALDYCPPTDLKFADYLSALLTVDREVVPDDTKYNYREILLRNFQKFGIQPAEDADTHGLWPLFKRNADLTYARTRFDSLLRDKEEAFRFIWENQGALGLSRDAYIEVESVRPCSRIGPDGFILRETVVDYVQILTIRADELQDIEIGRPEDMPTDLRVRLFGGGAMIFDEYGQLKYHIHNSIRDKKRQTARLKYLWESGYFDAPTDTAAHFANLHLARALS